MTLRVLFDSNILIQMLEEEATSDRFVIDFPDVAISIVTWMEVLIGAKNPLEKTRTREFLSTYPILDLSSEIAEETVNLRRSRGLKLPDAMIWATARVHGVPLVTLNTRDFPRNDPGVIIP